MEPYEVTRISSISAIPWLIKPVYGLISDSYPIFGMRRKPYLLFFGTLCCCMWLYMAVFIKTKTIAVLTIFTISLCSAFCNVIGEALVVETSKKQAAGDANSGSKNVSLFFGVRAFGYLCSAYFSGMLLEYLDKRQVFKITAIFPLLIVFSALLLQENNLDEQQGTEEKEEITLSSQLSTFYTFLCEDYIYKPILFIFLFMATPSYDDPLVYFYTSVLHFTPIVLGRIKLVCGLGSVIGIFLYNNYLHDVSFKKIIWCTTILCMFLNMLTILLVNRVNVLFGIPDVYFTIASGALATVLAEINTMPLLVLACNICPKNIEGTLYAFIMSVTNLGSIVSSQMGALATSMLGISNNNFVNLPWLIFIANICYLIPMPFLGLIKESSYLQKKQEYEEVQQTEQI